MAYPTGQTAWLNLYSLILNRVTQMALNGSTYISQELVNEYAAGSTLPNLSKTIKDALTAKVKTISDWADTLVVELAAGVAAGDGFSIAQHDLAVVSKASAQTALDELLANADSYRALSTRKPR